MATAFSSYQSVVFSWAWENWAKVESVFDKCPQLSSDILGFSQQPDLIVCTSSKNGGSGTTPKTAGVAEATPTRSVSGKKTTLERSLCKNSESHLLQTRAFAILTPLFMDTFSSFTTSATMWLIDTHSYRLVEVNGPDDQPYSILSHTWGKTGEVTFADMKDLQLAKAKEAWPKVERTCALAQEQGIRYAWIDTCCIDKSSSAELTEAINSMFAWYKRANVCYAYLSDLPASPDGTPDSPVAEKQLKADLDKCQWFRRGWTLQELIAPRDVEFYDQNWTRRGSKRKAKFCHQISRITNIEGEVLMWRVELATIPVARKMSWAARRKTTRVEDIAYSLLGIFGVNLPLIYGEGEKAFIRLQEAIAHSTNDLSLFAWSESEGKPTYQQYHGVLAQSPEQFAGCRHLAHIADPLRHDNQSFTITNRGIEFQTCLNINFTSGDYSMHLYCRDTSVQLAAGRQGMIAIRLLKISSGFARHCVHTVFVDDQEAAGNSTWDQSIRPVPVAKLITPDGSLRVGRRLNEAFRFKVDTPAGVKWQMSTLDPSIPIAERDLASSRPSYWDPAASIFLTDGYEYFTGMLYLSFSSCPGQHFVILCGLMPPPNNSSSTKSKLITWVTVYAPPPSGRMSGLDSTSDAQGRTINLADILQQKTHVHYPHFLAYTGRRIRERVHRGGILPNKACHEVRPFKMEGTILLAHSQSITVSGTTMDLYERERIHEVKISLKQQTVVAEPPR